MMDEIEQIAPIVHRNLPRGIHIEAAVGGCPCRQGPLIADPLGRDPESASRGAGLRLVMCRFAIACSLCVLSPAAAPTTSPIPAQLPRICLRHQRRQRHRLDLRRGQRPPRPRAAVGQNPVAVAASPTRNEVYVVNSGAAGGQGSVSVINAENNAVAATIPVHRQPVCARSRSRRRPGLRRQLRLQHRLGPRPEGAPRNRRHRRRRRAGCAARLSRRQDAGRRQPARQLGEPHRPRSRGRCAQSSTAAPAPAMSSFFPIRPRHSQPAPAATRSWPSRSRSRCSPRPRPDRRRSPARRGPRSPCNWRSSPTAAKSSSPTRSAIPSPKSSPAPTKCSALTSWAHDPVRGLVSADNSLLYVGNLRSQEVTVYSIDDGKRIRLHPRRRRARRRWRFPAPAICSLSSMPAPATWPWCALRRIRCSPCSPPAAAPTPSPSRLSSCPRLGPLPGSLSSPFPNRATLNCAPANRIRPRNIRPEQQPHRNIKRPVERLQVQMRQHRDIDVLGEQPDNPRHNRSAQNWRAGILRLGRIQ